MGWLTSPWLKKAAPVILSAAAGAGVVGTAVLAAKATPAALERKKAAEEEKGEALTTWEAAKAMAPSYIPAAISGAATLTSIGSLAWINRKQEARMASVVAGSSQLLNHVSRKYGLLRDEVQEKDPDMLKEFEEKYFDQEWNEYVKNRMAHKAAKCLCQGAFPDCFGEDWGEVRLFGIEYGNGLADENGNEMIFCEATPGDIITAFYNLNGLYRQDGMKYVNDLFTLLNLPHTHLGDMLVWDPSVLLDEFESDWIGFTTEDMEMEDDVPQPATCTLIRFTIPPLAKGYAEGMGLPDPMFPRE